MTRSDEAGFTLIEMLASLVVLGMISMLLFTGIGSGRRVWERLEDNRGAGRSVESAQTLLRERIERVFPATRYDGSAPYVDFQGAQGAMRFLAPPRPGESSAVLSRYEVALTPRGELVLSARNNLSLRPGSETTVLLTGVQAVDIAYFGPAQPDNLPRWRDRWEAQPAAPELVRLRLVFQPGDRRMWPELVVRPAASVDSRCVFDAKTGGCRGRS